MPEKILNDSFSIVPVEVNKLFDLKTDFYGIKLKYDEALKKYGEIARIEKEKTPKIADYLAENNIEDPKESRFLPAKHYEMLVTEAKARLSKDVVPLLLFLDPINHISSSLELLENLENVDLIKSQYKWRKKNLSSTKNAGISTEESEKVKYCLRQGRELYLAGKLGSLMVKPLNYFYSITAYSYAAIILNNPLKHSINQIPGSHGLNFVPDRMEFQLGANQPQGAFTDLHGSITNGIVKDTNTEIVYDLTRSISSYYENNITISVGALLSMVPEIRDYYKMITGKHSRSHPIAFTRVNHPRDVIWEAHIGDGETKPNQQLLEKSFPGFPISEKYGKIVVEIRQDQSAQVCANIVTDMYGKFWYIDNPVAPVVLHLPAIHFLLTNALSNIMRYSPEKWGAILLNETNSDISLIVRKYLSSFESLFPSLFLRMCSKYYPFVGKE